MNGCHTPPWRQPSPHHRHGSEQTPLGSLLGAPQNSPRAIQVSRPASIPAQRPPHLNGTPSKPEIAASPPEQPTKLWQKFCVFQESKIMGVLEAGIESSLPCCQESGHWESWNFPHPTPHRGVVQADSTTEQSPSSKTRAASHQSDHQAILPCSVICNSPPGLQRGIVLCPTCRCPELSRRPSVCKASPVPPCSSPSLTRCHPSTQPAKHHAGMQGNSSAYAQRGQATARGRGRPFGPPRKPGTAKPRQPGARAVIREDNGGCHQKSGFRTIRFLLTC